ncbi:MAG: pilus assembly protein [Dehalococcoidia bacterium]|nr:pilus assembly protein [Dehalococcoidia bacterium]
MFRRIIRRTGKEEGGQSLVEFAFVLPIFLLVLFAIVDFGMAFNAWLTVTNSAREGARLGTIHAPAVDIEQRVRNTASSLDQADLTVTVTNADGDPGTSVVVDVSYTYSVMTPVAGLVSMVSGGTVSDTFTISSTADMRLE